MSTTPENQEYEAPVAEHVDGDGGTGSDREWLRRARLLYADSTDYYSSGLFDKWRANLAHFRSEHAPGSKYTKKEFAGRSKIFRPKPRASVRTLEATAAAALFTNEDLVNVRGVDEGNALQAEAARLHKSILQHRLETSIPWFLTAIGAYQDTNVYGICISKQHWDYRERRKVEVIPAVDELGQPIMDEDGALLGEEVEQVTVTADKPAIDMIAPENFRYDPAADWRMPVETSPYLIELIPMYAMDVQAMAANGWEEYTLGELVAHGSDPDNDGETVRDAREGHGRQDAHKVSDANEYSIIWVRFYIIRDEEGEDWCFYTVGDGLMLTEPMPLEDYDPLGRARYAVGFSSIEAHRSHPSGTIELSRPLTEAINEVTNQRMDNVRLVLNKRYVVRRGANMDLGAMMRNVPGGGVMTDDPERDLRVLETNDVTQSSYVEQDRLSVENDELLGTFSQASVQSNRALNETVGGMNLMASGANQVQELGLRIFIESWVEPVLRALIKLQALYETDETVLALAAGKAEIQHEIDDNLMMQDLVVKVNVGMGNTNPEQKLARFMMPLNAAAQLPEFLSEVNFYEVGKEIFALTGHGDGARFLLTDEQKQQRAEAQQGQGDPRIMVKEMEMQIRQLELEQQAILKQMEIESRQQIEMQKLAASQDMKMSELQAKLGIKQQELNTMAQLEAARDQTRRDIAALTNKYNQLRMSLKAQNMQMGFDSFG